MSKQLNWFVISDLHLHHERIIEYCRPQFEDLDEMHEYIMNCWNSVVQPHDTVYVLGDVTFRKEGLVWMKENLNGHKELVLGNHDTFTMSEYGTVFKRVHGARAVHLKDGSQIILTHIPVHPDQVRHGYGRYRFNIHGHYHANTIKKQVDDAGNFWEENNGLKVDPRYISACCEVLNFTPMRISDLLKNHL